MYVNKKLLMLVYSHFIFLSAQDIIFFTCYYDSYLYDINFYVDLLLYDNCFI